MAGDARRCANGRGAFGKDRGGAITRSETRGGDRALRGRTPRALAGETERDCAEGRSGARSGGGFAPCVGTQAEQHGGGGFVGRIAAGFAGPLSVRVADRTGASGCRATRSARRQRRYSAVGDQSPVCRRREKKRRLCEIDRSSGRRTLRADRSAIERMAGGQRGGARTRKRRRARLIPAGARACCARSREK